MEVIMKGQEVKLRWLCPECGQPVYEDTTPINAIDHAKVISADPMCFPCRSRNGSIMI
jgi:hypothetical protein